MPLIHGETSDQKMVPVRVEATNELAAALKGLISGALQAQPILLGYSGQEAGTTQSASAGGTKTISVDAVPAGEIWVVEAITGVDLNNAPTRVEIGVVISGSFIVLANDAAPAAGIFSVWTGAVTIEEGNQVRVVFYGTTAADQCRVRYIARRVDIDQ